MANMMICDIVAPDQMLYSGEVTFVSAPAADGEIGFMYLCSPLMSTLRRGLVRIKETEAGEAKGFVVDGGYVEADGRKVVVLASRAIALDEVDIAISSERIAMNEKRLSELPEEDSRAVFVREEIEWQEYLMSVRKAKG